LPKIDPAARVSPNSVLAHGVTIGPFSVVGDGVEIGAGTHVGPFCTIEGPTVIGSSCTFTGYASIGTPPQDHSYDGEPTRLTIGDGNTFREFVTVNRGTMKDRGETLIGNHNLVMAYCHVAHDCVLGDHVVMGNLATLAGHVQIHDHAIIGGMSAVHQFTRVGAYTIVGGGSMVSLDIVPYARASGDRAKIFGVNTIGLRRCGFTPERITMIEKGFRIVFRQGLLLKEALGRLEAEFPGEPVIEGLASFLKTTRRGITR
jgi:UDP-N-acetylglucosamine acyltransferase